MQVHCTVGALTVLSLVSRPSCRPDLIACSLHILQTDQNWTVGWAGNEATFHLHIAGVGDTNTSTVTADVFSVVNGAVL